MKIIDYFDKIYLLNLVTAKERRDFFFNQLHALGVDEEWVKSGKFEVINAVKLPHYNQELIDFMRDKNMAEFKNVPEAMCAYEHYRILKASIELGYERVLILEDDVCFIKDLSLISKAIENAPEDYDVLHFEGFSWPNPDQRETYEALLSESPLDAKWVSMHKFPVWDTAALGYSRKGMQKYIEVQENKMRFADLPTATVLRSDSYIYSYPLFIQEDKNTLNSIINPRLVNNDDVNVYHAKCNLLDYYHVFNFQNIYDTTYLNNFNYIEFENLNQYRYGNADTDVAFDKFMKDHKYVYIKAGPDEYRWMGMHHYYPKWHYENTLPVIANKLRFSYDLNDFEWNNFRTMDVLVPKKKPVFDVDYFHFYDITPENEFSYYKIKDVEVPFDDLFNVNEVYNDGANPILGLFDDYHRLFKFSHQSCRLVNKMCKNNNKLIVSSDSHLIPLVPILSYYFKEVVIIDKRRNLFYDTGGLYGDGHFTHMLMMTSKIREIETFINVL